MARVQQEWYHGHPHNAEGSVLFSMASDQRVVLLLIYLIKKCYGRELEDALTKVYLQYKQQKTGKENKGLIDCVFL